MADGFDLDKLVCPSKELLAALEEVSENPCAGRKRARDIELVGDFAQLVNLRAGQKLCLVDEHAIDGAGGGGELMEIVGGREGASIGLESDPRGDSPVPARVSSCGVNNRV